MFSDPWFYVVSVPAVLLYGIAKGGFGGAIAILAVPLMTLVMPPTQAAAILLPILVVMDLLVVKTYWGTFDRTALKLLLPGATVGVLLGFVTVGAMNDDVLRIMIGLLALVFGLQYLLQRKQEGHKAHHAGSASVLGALAGFTSFSIHAGGPPLTVYLLPRGLTPLLFAGTAGMFFAIVNALKLVPYYWLGQFTADNLLYSLALVPLAPVGVKIGHYLVKLSTSSFYYAVVSLCLALIGGKLLWDGLSAL